MAFEVRYTLDSKITNVWKKVSVAANTLAALKAAVENKEHRNVTGLFKKIDGSDEFEEGTDADVQINSKWFISLPSQGNLRYTLVISSNPKGISYLYFVFGSKMDFNSI